MLTEPLYHNDDDELYHHAQDVAGDTYINYPPPTAITTNNQELIELKLQLAQQKEKVDKISSQLKACQAENDVLKIENKSLLDQLAPNRKEEQILRPSSSRWFSTRRVRDTTRDTTTPGSATGGGSMQMLLDANSKLMVDNARLQSENVNVRKCFQSYIMGTKKKTKQKEDKNNIKYTSYKKSSSRSEASTATTSLNSSSYDDIDVESIEQQKEELHIDDDALISRRHTMTVVPTDIKKNIAKVAAKTSSSSSSYTSANGDELLVEFGETTYCRKWQSLVVDIIN